MTTRTIIVATAHEPAHPEHYDAALGQALACTSLEAIAAGSLHGPGQRGGQQLTGPVLVFDARMGRARHQQDG